MAAVTAAAAPCGLSRHAVRCATTRWQALAARTRSLLLRAPRHQLWMFFQRLLEQSSGGLSIPPGRDGPYTVYCSGQA